MNMGLASMARGGLREDRHEDRQNQHEENPVRTPKTAKTAKTASDTSEVAVFALAKAEQELVDRVAALDLRWHAAPPPTRRSISDAAKELARTIDDRMVTVEDEIITRMDWLGGHRDDPRWATRKAQFEASTLRRHAELGDAWRRAVEIGERPWES